MSNPCENPTPASRRVALPGTSSVRPVPDVESQWIRHGLARSLGQVDLPSIRRIRFDSVRELQDNRAIQEIYVESATSQLRAELGARTC